MRKYLVELQNPKKNKRINNMWWKTLSILVLATLVLVIFARRILIAGLLNLPTSMECDPLSIAIYAYKSNPWYKSHYLPTLKDYKDWDQVPFTALPYVTKEDIIQNNDTIRNPFYKPCKLKCNPSCASDPVLLDTSCAFGQSTGGTSGKSAFIWMSHFDAYRYLQTFMRSFRANGYTYGDRLMVFYPTDSYFTNEYERSNATLLRYLNIFFLSFKTVEKADAERFVEVLNTKKPEFLVIFPFVLLKLCMLIKRHSLPLRHIPKCINVSGEFVLNCSKQIWKSVFPNSRIENTYGAVEFGEIAHEVLGEKHTFKVFNNICYVENKEDKLVVTSYINKTFPLIRYVMEDIGNVEIRGRDQYITNLVGKATNQIQIAGKKLDTIELDKIVDSVNKENKIASVVVRYSPVDIIVHYICIAIPRDKEQIRQQTTHLFHQRFPNVDIRIRILEDYQHNYLKKFKIIEKSNKEDTEPVGGYYKT